MCKISQRAIFLKQRGRNKEKFLYVEWRTQVASADDVALDMRLNDTARLEIYASAWRPVRRSLGDCAGKTSLYATFHRPHCHWSPTLSVAVLNHSDPSTIH